MGTPPGFCFPHVLPRQFDGRSRLRPDECADGGQDPVGGGANLPLVAFGPAGDVAEAGATGIWNAVVAGQDVGDRFGFDLHFGSAAGGSGVVVASVVGVTEGDVGQLVRQHQCLMPFGGSLVDDDAACLEVGVPVAVALQRFVVDGVAPAGDLGGEVLEYPRRCFAVQWGDRCLWWCRNGFAVGLGDIEYRDGSESLDVLGLVLFSGVRIGFGGGVGDRCVDPDRLLSLAYGAAVFVLPVFESRQE